MQHLSGRFQAHKVVTPFLWLCNDYGEYYCKRCRLVVHLPSLSLPLRLTAVERRANHKVEECSSRWLEHWQDICPENALQQCLVSRTRRMCWTTVPVEGLRKNIATLTAKHCEQLAWLYWVRAVCRRSLSSAGNASRLMSEPMCTTRL